MTPSPQQAAVIDWVRNGRGSAFVEAVAGAGKTTTLLHSLAEMDGYISLMAFNKKIADEIKGKVADRSNPRSDNYDPKIARLGNRLRIGTCHSFGLGTWRRAYPAVKIADGRDKTDKMIEALQLPKQLHGFVPKLISLAKQSGAGLLWQVTDESRWYDIIDRHDLAYDVEADDVPGQPTWVERGVAAAIAGLQWHRDIGTELIDFDDMIWLPVISGTRFFQVDWVMGDEWQDTNPIRRALARKMLKPNGRAMFVGDRHQAIYGFTGADNDAIDQVVREFKCTQLPLTVTFRCPQAVVAEARTVVSHIEAHETAPAGLVGYSRHDEFMKLATTQGELTPHDAILCRNTKPLVQTAYALIKRGVACHVEGHDIGMGLLKLVNRFDARTLDQLIDKLQAYGEQQSAKLIAKGRETQAEALMDRIETILVIAEGCKDADCVRTKIMNMFQDSENERKPTLTLSTVHKSKGREWQRVFILGREMYMPSKYARQQWQIEQERNLEYVAITRAQSELIFVEAEPVS